MHWPPAHASATVHTLPSLQTSPSVALALQVSRSEPFSHTRLPVLAQSPEPQVVGTAT